MGQEFIIKSQNLEDKINQLLPSQGGFAAGVDLSASTTVIPIVDLTETAEGSTVRQDLQTALDTASTQFRLTGVTNTVLVNTTGFYRVFGSQAGSAASGFNASSEFNLFDGATSNRIIGFEQGANSQAEFNNNIYDFVVFIKAGVSLRGSADGNSFLVGSTRQIADINGNLTNPQGF